MKAKVNNILYENVEWTDGILSFATDLSLDEIEHRFSIPGDIIIYENDEQIAKYYNKGVGGLAFSTVDGARYVTVQFNVALLTPDTESDIRESMESSDSAIVELAELLSGISEQITSILDRLDAIEARLPVGEV